MLFQGLHKSIASASWVGSQHHVDFFMKNRHILETSKIWRCPSHSIEQSQITLCRFYLKKAIDAHRALAELKHISSLLPNQVLSIQTRSKIIIYPTGWEITR